MRQKLGFVGRNIHLNRAIAFASFACQAKVESLLDCFAFPSIFENVALHHVEKQMRSAAGGVFLVTVKQHGRTRVRLAGDVVQIDGRRLPYIAGY